MSNYQLIFFVIALICAAPVLYWYYRRHSHPRFRPKLGEMAMVALFAVMLSLGGSLLIGGLMDDPEQFRADGSFGRVPMSPKERRGIEAANQREERSGSSGSREGGSREGSSRDGGSRKSDGR